MRWNHLITRRQRPVWVLSALILVSYVAATQHTQPLLWLIAALLLAAILMALLLPWLQVGKLTVHRSLPDACYEQQTAEMIVNVSHQGRLPALMLDVYDRLPFVSAERTLLGTLPFLASGKQASFTVQLTGSKRGVYDLGPTQVVSSFPLGLFERSRQQVNSLSRFTVYPQLFPVSSLPLSGDPAEMHRGEYRLQQGHGSAVFTGLREYQPGDHPRYIHWPSTARQHMLMVKEFEPVASASLMLVPDLDVRNNLGEGREAMFEYMMRMAASVARYATDQGLQYRVFAPESRWSLPTPGSSEAHFRQAMEVFAAMQAETAQAYSQTLQQAMLLAQPGETMMVWIGADDTEFLTIYAQLQAMVNAGLHLLMVVLDRGSFGDRKQQSDWSGLHALGYPCFKVRQGDDLMRSFM